MKHHVEFYAKQKKQTFDKSTIHDMSTEEPQEHPSFYKNKPKDKWFNVIVIPACIWAALAYFNSQYNIGQGDLNPHTWGLMNAATAVLLLYWSTKLFEWLVNKDYKYEFVKALGGFVCGACFVTFIGSGLYLVKIIFEFIANFFN